VILVDSSVWIDHIRASDPFLVSLLTDRHVLVHPFVIGEVALGQLHPRVQVLEMLHRLPEALVARDGEVLRLIEAETLFGVGIGYVDAHLLAACRLTRGAKLWTRDKRLAAVAERLGLVAGPHVH
jgi:predicted nucleic acid-binding protein